MTHRKLPARGTPGAPAWSLVHGFSTLWLNDAVNADTAASDPMELVLRMARMLFEG